MARLILFELKKMLSRRVALAANIGVAVFLVGIMALNVVQNKTANAHGQIVSGTEAIAVARAEAEKYAGPVSAERAAQDIAAYQERLFARIDPEAERFVEVGFRSHGCLAAIGCATVTAHLLQGKSFEEALEISDDDLLDALDGLPVGRKYTLGYAREAVKALIGDFYLREKHFTLAQLDEVLPCDSMCVDCLLTENCSLRDSRVDQYMREAGEIE